MSGMHCLIELIPLASAVALLLLVIVLLPSGAIQEKGMQQGLERSDSTASHSRPPERGTSAPRLSDKTTENRDTRP